ncbi:MAG: NUDIX domain-containing protein [Candidatus Saccharimonadales bacterium]
MNESKPNQPKKKQQTNNNRPNHNRRRRGGKFHNIRRRISRTVEEETAGGVVFRRGKDSIEILMIQDIKGRWTIPKGHVEEGERIEETALREIEEETGLKYLKILNKLGKIDFRYRKLDKLILMTTHIFLIHAFKDSGNYRPEESEGIKDVKWFPANEALDLIEYDDIGKLFLIALKKIRHGGY